MKVDSLFNNLNNTDSPGAAVLIVQDGEVLFKRGYGMANFEKEVPITPSTVFDIASLSKQFTGMAISMLIEQGKISLDDDIRQYIPEMPNFDHKITIDYLIHHTSGLRDWGNTLPLGGCRLDDTISFDQILNMTYNQQDLNFEPGSEYSYSNTEYNILAELVHRVTGQTFREWTDINIFEPLGMKNTHFRDGFTEVFTNQAYSYEKRLTGYYVINNGLEAVGSSSLFTSINDLAKWVINLDNPVVGGKSVIDRMFQPGMLNNGEKISYGFGLVIDQFNGMKIITHSGGWAGFNTFLAYIPELHFSIVVLYNFQTDYSKTVIDIANIYLGNKFEQLTVVDKPKISDTVHVPIAILDKYVGIYRLGPAWYVTISRNGDRLMTRATAENIFPMDAISDSVFWVKAYDSSIKFNCDASGNVNSINYREMTCKKVQSKVQTENTTLKDFVGEYFSDELKTTYNISIEYGQLVAKHINNGTIRLTCAWKDDFRGSIYYMKSVEFYRDKEGKVAGFMVSTDRSRNQRFIKVNN